MRKNDKIKTDKHQFSALNKGGKHVSTKKSSHFTHGYLGCMKKYVFYKNVIELKLTEQTQIISTKIVNIHFFIFIINIIR
jgi:hypothetical protein